MSKRVAVIGGGPVGLEAAAYARALDLPAVLFEAGRPGDHVARWGHVRMFSPFGWNVSPLARRLLLRDNPKRLFPADIDILTGREFLEAYLSPLAECEELRPVVRANTRVLAVGRVGWRKTDAGDPRKPLPPFRLLVREGSGAERFETADVVLDCTGSYATPNPVGDGGIPAAGEGHAKQFATLWPDDIAGAKANHYAGRTVAVVGGGFSAATAVTELAGLAAQHPSTWIVWLTHGPKGQPLPRVPNDPLRERDKLAVKANALACRCDGNLEYHAQTAIDEIVCHGPDGGFRLTGRTAGKPVTWEVERLIAHVGYRADHAISDGLRPVEPGYYVLGAKAGGSGFLLRDGLRQVRAAFAAALADPRLDLYAAKAA